MIRRWNDKGGTLGICGCMREGGLFRDGLVLERSISTECYSNRATLVDKVRNTGFSEVPLFLLHHFNFGYLFLDAGTRIVSKDACPVPWDSAFQEGLANALIMGEPMDGAQEQVFLHVPQIGKDGMASVTVINDTLTLAVTIRFDPAVRPFLMQWKSTCSGSYALGIEPSTCLVEGREALTEQGRLPATLKPGEERTFRLQIDVLEGDAVFALSSHGS